MIWRLALRTLSVRPWRTLALLAGYAIGVGVMIVLLSIGEAMMAQGREERLVGGGTVTVLPEGLDLEVLKTGGLGGMYFSIPNARFVYEQMLTSPRWADTIVAVAPQIEGKLLYLRLKDDRLLTLRATGEIPSRSAAVGAAPTITAGRWEDDDEDRAWSMPTPRERLAAMDHFHETPAAAPDRATWAEWHYFNLRTPDADRWAFLTFALAGDVPQGDWRGEVSLTWHQTGRAARRFAMTVPREAVRYSTTDADLTLGGSSVRLDEAGRYVVTATAREIGVATGATARVALVVTPEPRAYFPNAAIGGDDLLSGYAVPVLRGTVHGEICLDARCTRFDAAPAYHDHNWGTWRAVAWEWGVVQAGSFGLLYGRVERTDALAVSEPLFLYLTDSLGFRTLMRPKRIHYDDTRRVVVAGVPVMVPARATLEDIRGADTLTLALDVEDAMVTDIRDRQRGDGSWRDAPRPYFVQLKGRATLRGRVGGRAIDATGVAFFETYR